MAQWHKSIATFTLGSFVLLSVIAPVVHRVEHATDYRAHIHALEAQTQHVHGEGQLLTQPYEDVQDLDEFTCILCQQVEPRAVGIQAKEVVRTGTQQRRNDDLQPRITPGLLDAYPVRGPPSTQG